MINIHYWLKMLHEGKQTWKLKYMCLIRFWHLSKLTKNFIFITDTDVNKPLVCVAKLCAQKSFLFTHIERNLLLKTISLFIYEWHLKEHSAIKGWDMLQMSMAHHSLEDRKKICWHWERFWLQAGFCFCLF